MSAPTPIKADPASVLVAIPTLNEAAHIEATLTALMQDDPDMAQVQIVVADGGSTDATREIVQSCSARWPNITLIDNPDKLQAAAINRVVRDHAGPDHRILVRVDAHAAYPARYVLDVADALLTRDVAGLATVMDSQGENCFQRGAAMAMETKLGSGGSGHRGGTVSGYVDHGHHAGFLLAAFNAAGGYDTGFVANEDAELDYRIRLAGGRIWLDAGIRLGYVMRAAPMGLARQYWRYGRGRAQTVFRHGIRPKLRQMVPPVAVVVNLVSLILSPALPLLLVFPLAYLMLCLVTSLVLAARHSSLCALWAGPALAIMHHTWGAGFLIQALTKRGRPA
jgi:succinoglycan biosynthesis protein ExoA